VALVVTLIMLSVITIVAVTFLAMSRRERTSVTQTLNLTGAKTMADAALERAKGQIMAPILATTNMLNGDMAVSRNYINTNGFQPGVSRYDNVSYVYRNGQPLNQDDFLQNLTNLLIDPRPPVFVRTNRPGTPPALEFRFYVDLNRNGQFETNGFFLDYDNLGNPINPERPDPHWFVGDPEWIGVLEKPNLPHSANNRFIGRYAYIILPVGKTLDVNFIHNQSQSNFLAGLPNPGRFYRDQGFGTYEINLAAFLAALNTNSAWADPRDPNPGYRYSTNGFSAGTAFADALDFVQYRYRGGYTNEDTVASIFGQNALTFINDHIDGLGREVAPPPAGLIDDEQLHPWPGASSRQHWYSVHDFFDNSRFPTITLGANFAGRLGAASNGTNSHDRYTYYRLLSELGTDSAQEPAHADIPRLKQQIGAYKQEDFLADTVGRINLNYDNIYHTAPEFVNWDPLVFFTNLGSILISNQYGIDINDIPVTPTNPYPSSLQRLLQVAANIHDGTTTDFFPSVFLPVTATIRDPFATNRTATTKGITGYTTNLNRATAIEWALTNTYGLPAIVGAKKGLPNFNEFVFQTHFQITRKLEVARPDLYSLPNQTNQLLIVGISNLVAVENWNSYSNAFPSNFQVYVTNSLSFTLIDSNDANFIPISGIIGAGADFPVLVASNAAWYFKPKNPALAGYANGFMVPLYTNVAILASSRYKGGKLDGLTNSVLTDSWLPRNGDLRQPDWRLAVSNRLTYIASSLPPGPTSVDVPNGKVFDLVSVSVVTNLNLTELLQSQDTDTVYPSAIAALWDTNRNSKSALASVPTEGILRQIAISMGSPTLSAVDWTSFNGTTARPQDKDTSIQYFSQFVSTTSGFTPTNRFAQAPFTASRRFVHTMSWQANDPLVHYLLADMRGGSNAVTFVRPNDIFTNNLNLGRLNEQYDPWLGNPNKDNKDQIDPDDIYVGVKDPGVFGSDDWDFPSQKLPSIGWLGRVHRGTPWQTIYLKAEVAPPARWLRHSPDMRSHPTNDWRLLDIFTVAQTPNASRGQLSINQSGVAAWSAVLGSITVLSNTMPNLNRRAPTLAGGNFNTLVVEPITNAPVIQRIVDAVNVARLRLTNQTFRSVGDLMSVPELTTRSPFLNFMPTPDGFSADDIGAFGFNDEAYERIPRSILSLLKVGDARYVVYAFGQSLKPADKSIVTSALNPNYFGICTNYQITGEVFTRSVVKIEGPTTTNVFNPRPTILNYNILPAD
jgi:hypothetical protein